MVAGPAAVIAAARATAAALAMAVSWQSRVYHLHHSRRATRHTTRRSHPPPPPLHHRLCATLAAACAIAITADAALDGNAGLAASTAPVLATFASPVSPSEKLYGRRNRADAEDSDDGHTLDPACQRRESGAGSPRRLGLAAGDNHAAQRHRPTPANKCKGEICGSVTRGRRQRRHHGRPYHSRHPCCRHPIDGPTSRTSRPTNR